MKETIMKELLFFIVAAIIVTACAKEYDSNLISDNGIELIADSVEYSNLMNKMNSDSFHIDSVYASYDWIFCQVSYSGGCKEHIFTAVWDENIYVDSLAHISVLITHNSNGDSCEAYINDELGINISLLTDGKNLDFEHRVYHIINDYNKEVYTLSD